MKYGDKNIPAEWKKGNQRPNVLKNQKRNVKTKKVCKSNLSPGLHKQKHMKDI